MSLSNSDMDQLFRDAADNYPLKTDNSDWDKVAAALQEPEEKPKSAAWWPKVTAMAVIALLVGGSIFYFASDSSSDNIGAVKPSVVVKQQKTPDYDVSSAAAQKSGSEVPSIIADEKIPVNQKRSVPATMSASGGTSEPADLSLKRNELKNMITATDQIKNEVRKDELKQPIQQAVNDQKDVKLNVTEQKKAEEIKEETTPTTVNDLKKVKDGEKNLTTAATTVVKAKPVKQAKLYVTALLGVDKSHIDLQKFSNWGYSYGASVGYNINRRLSVEAGLLSSSKKYYTAAQYFNTAKMYSPSYVKYQDFTGECRMLEIPVLVRYNFDPGKNTQWFLSAGVSSYLMNKESYDYNYLFYSQHRTGSRAYYKASKDWLSAVHISGGTEVNFSKNSSLRIEPYIRIPVKKMGYGEMKISSVGMNVGFRRNIF